MELINIKFKQKNQKKFKLSLSYQIYSELSDTIQNSYHICFFNEQKLIWDSGIILSKSTDNIDCSTDNLENHHKYRYVITIDTNNGVIQNEGVLSVDYIVPKWKADWIKLNYDSEYSKTFKINGPVHSGYLYLSSNQIINPVINGFNLNCINNDIVTEDGIHAYDVSNFLQNGINNFQIFHKSLDNQEAGLRYELHIVYENGKVKNIKSESDQDLNFIPLMYKYCVQETIEKFNVIFKNKFKIYDCGRIVFGKPAFKDYIKNKCGIIICSETVDFYKSVKYDLSSCNYLNYSKFRYFIIDDISCFESSICIEDYGLKLEPVYKFFSSNFYVNEIWDYNLNYINIYYSERLFIDKNFTINELAFVSNYLLLNNYNNNLATELLNSQNLKDCLDLEAKTPLTGLFDVIEIVWNVYKNTNNKLLLKKYYSTLKKLINKISVDNFAYPETELSIYYYYVNIMIEIAEILDDEKNANFYKNKLKKISKNYCKIYINSDGYLKNENIISYAFAIVSGIANIANYNAAETAFYQLTSMIINNEYNKEEIVIYLPIIMEALMIARKENLAFSLMSEYYDELRKDINPVTSLSLINFFKKCVMGIYDNYDGGDSRSIIIKPLFKKTVDKLEATSKYQEGELIYSYIYNNNSIKFSINVPANLNCTVIMPNGKICKLNSGNNIFEKNN